MYIREFRIGDEMALHAVFHCAIHKVASQFYTSEQIKAWAPEVFDHGRWIAQMQKLRPYVLEHADRVVAYADVQADGYIDHFFVSATHARQGLGVKLMTHLHEQANTKGIVALTSDVSLAAQPFFEKFGFIVIERKTTVIRGVVLQNALMRKELVAGNQQ